MSWLIIILILVIGFGCFFYFIAWGVAAGMENRYWMDKYDLLTTIADDNIELQQQKDLFINRALETGFFADAQNNHIRENIHQLIYPNLIYAPQTCPFCDGKVFWIFDIIYSKAGNKDSIVVRYYTLCASCVNIFHHYDENIYDRDVFKRIESFESSKSYIGKIDIVRYTRYRLKDELQRKLWLTNFIIDHNVYSEDMEQNNPDGGESEKDFLPFIGEDTEMPF